MEPTINLYKPLAYLNIEKIYVFKTCTFIHSVLLGNKKSNLIFKSVEILHSHETRQIKQLQTCCIKTNIGKNSVLYKGLIMYNSLPVQIKKI